MSIKPRNLLLPTCAVLLLLACAFAGCSSNQAISPPPLPSERNVIITDTEYIPYSIEISAGTTVNWTNTGKYFHTVDSNVGEDMFNSPPINPGNSWQHTYYVPGLQAYHDANNHQLTGLVKVLK